ncbi:MAG TPA: TMEM175 family protein [Panacibacter sp.]|nr:TMEM175 family protein [Panacibacter sp.]
MLRQAIGKKIEAANKTFRLRGHEVKRIEAFSDAVFAFAVTLLIVSLEVPKSFEELMQTMRGFLPFSICFLILMMIWYEQNIFFRRYGMDDKITIVLNSTLIFLVLFYVYPLKFLFTVMFSGQIYTNNNSPFEMDPADSSTLMLVYGAGFVFIYLLFLFMYAHALKKKESLELTSIEAFETRTKIFSNLIFVIIGLSSVITALLLPANISGLAGFIYFTIGPAISFFYSYRARKRKKLL